jgi:hypothetical protein
VTAQARTAAASQPAAATQLVEIVCDESGYEGEKHIGAVTDVFTHASVVLDVASAAACVQELRKRIRSPAEEYKANHLLREKNRSALVWLLGPSGPLHGAAHVYLVDKPFFLVDKFVKLLIDEPGDMALTLHRQGRNAFGDQLWAAFLESANNLLRSKDRLDLTTSVEEFYRAIEVLRCGETGLGEIVQRLSHTRPRAEAFRRRIFADPTVLPVLDPLFPALLRAVAYWGEGIGPVAIIHDRQNTLSQDRVAQIRMSGLTLVDSFSDPRVQVADFLAGTARKIASEELNGRGDAELTALLPPFMDAMSIWGDDRSWSRLAPTR